VQSAGSLADLLGDIGRGIGVEINNCHRGPARRETDRDRAADPTACARNKSAAA